MKHARLELARSAELLPELDGVTAVFGQVEIDRLRGLDRENLRCICHSFSVSQRIKQAGISVARELSEPAQNAVVFVPRAKAEAWQLIAKAQRAAPDGWIIVDGQKTDGIDSIAKQIVKTVSNAASYSKGHGKTIWFRAADAPVIEQAPEETSKNKGGFLTAPGVFSADDIDPASELLVSELPSDLSGSFADLGAGWGYLSARVLADNPNISSLHLVEDNCVALDCAGLNVVDPRAQFHWADALSWSPEKRLDGIIMNPPFHTSRDADPEIGKNFIKAAARALVPGGKLYMVANGHLPYEPILEQSFAKCELLTRTNRFKVFCATRGRGKVG